MRKLGSNRLEVEVVKHGNTWFAFDSLGTAIGHIVVRDAVDRDGVTQEIVDYIHVEPDYRRREVGLQLWQAAGRPLHTPWQSGDGHAFAQGVGGAQFLEPVGE